MRRIRPEDIKEIVYVEWQDPTVYTSRDINKIPELIKQYTAGMLIVEDKNFMRVALNVNDNYIGDYIDIPKSLIIYVKKYKIRQTIK